MRWLLSPFILWWHSHLATSTRHISPFELTVNSGAIRGERLLIDGQDYTVFKGIPFAMPPVGYLSAMCMQNIDENDAGEPERYVAHVSEDCLYLNVFSPTPYQYTNDTYPVIVFIHGGRFQTGSGSDIPQRAILSNFVSRKIVFVTFNYRLGPLGFASTGDSVLPGNIGLWDQIWALKWVKANAEVFGGDPSNILLMGHGTGAASASLLALSPRAEGLFQKVLLMSGSALQPGVVRNTQINATWNMNDRFGCRAFNSSELLDCARKRSKEEIFQYKRLHYDDYEEFVPIIDGVGGILPEPPEQLSLHKRRTPIVIGTTKDESSLRILLLNEKDLNFTSITGENGEKLAENLTMGHKQFQNHRLISQGCKSEYVWTQVDPSFPESVLFNSLLKMYSHFWYDAPASQLATYYLKQDLPVYLYSFDHISENFYDIDRAFHGVDKLHIFNVTPRFLNKRKDMNWQLDQRVVEIFSELVANFALYGTPTHENDGFSFNWTSTTAKELSYLSITDSPSMQFATAMLSFCSLFFFAILVGLACYCTRKESDEDEL
uniref:COesterase domain-containing protein n=1 Tax=Caenorhabditis tropicalis TaxID=1561998 RepID=A0A1I7TB73_9PELO